MMRDDALRNQILTDPHSPPAARGAMPERNIDAWYAAFGVKEGDKAYLAARAARPHLVASSGRRLRAAAASLRSGSRLTDAHDARFACRRRRSPPASRSPRQLAVRDRPPPARPALGTFGVDTAQMDRR